MQFHYVYKMNEIVNKFLLVGDKFMPEMHLKQPGFTYSTCGPFSKNKFIYSLMNVYTGYNLAVNDTIYFIYNKIIRVLFWAKKYENCTSMKLKSRGECADEVKFKFEHESKLKIEIQFEEVKTIKQSV